MSENIKNILGIALIAASLAFAFASVGYVLNQPDYSERTFSVSGEGEAIAVPDVGNFTFSVLTEGGTNLTALQEDNTEKSNAVINYLKKSGVDEEDIKSQNYSVSPRYQYNRCSSEDEVCPPRQIVGYTIRHTVSVKVRELEDAGSLLSGVVQNGANTVSQLTLSIDDPTELENEARAQAMEKAREKAEAIAKAGKFRIGKLISVSENLPYQPRAYALDTFEAAGLGGAGAPVPSIEPGSEKVTVNVMLTYEIK